MIRTFRIEQGLDDFKRCAREAIAAKIDPADIFFEDVREGAIDLFSQGSEAPHAINADARAITVPPAFAKLAVDLAHHSSPQRWSLLYRILWRLKFENSKLLEIAVDNDVRAAFVMQKAIHREVHKMHAFVRFQEVGDRFVAWMRTDHPCLPLASGLFVRRFGDRPWSILTPAISAHWDTKELTFGPGVDQPPEREESVDQLWKSYYKSIFNPARIKTKAMRAEMPTRYWAALPEASLIAEMLRDAPARLKVMAERANKEAKVPDTNDWVEVAKAAKSCLDCPIGHHATQTVFGEGPQSAQLMIVGEQPGEEEDLAGRPFVGPAGKIFDQALDFVGIDRSTLYVTNAVKHFKWKPAPGKPRLHQKPSGAEVHACKPWLEREIDIVKPKVILCLGQTAGTALVGRLVKITDEVGVVHRNSSFAEYVLISYHPSAILRAGDPAEAERMRKELARALAIAHSLATGHLPSSAAELEELGAD